MSCSDEQSIEQRFKLAVEWIASFLGPSVREGKLIPLPRLLSSHAAYLHMLLVEEQGRHFSFRAPRQDTIDNIISYIGHDPHSYDVVSALIGEGLLKEADIETTLRIEVNGRGRSIFATNPPPSPLKIIAGLMLTGVLQRPKQKGSPTTFGRDVMYYIAIENCEARYDLTPTRNPETLPRLSGCDALIKATEQVKLPKPSFATARAIWQRNKIREYLGHIRDFERLRKDNEGDVDTKASTRKELGNSVSKNSDLPSEH